MKDEGDLTTQLKASVDPAIVRLISIFVRHIFKIGLLVSQYTFVNASVLHKNQEICIQANL